MDFPCYSNNSTPALFFEYAKKAIPDDRFNGYLNYIDGQIERRNTAETVFQYGAVQ